MTDLATLIALADRAPAVMIRPDEDQGRYHWAGAEPPTGKYAELPTWRESGDVV